VIPADPSPDSAPAPAMRPGPAIGTWAAAWVLGSLVVAPLVVVGIGADLGDELSIPELAAAAVATWTVFVAALWFASRRFGHGDPIADYSIRFRAIDLVGVPIGVVAQLVLVPLLYVPLQRWWPDTFSDQQLEERARDLADRAGGATTVLLVLVVVVGAPIVEELVYRGLIQRSLTGALGAAPGLVLTAMGFALVHPSPVEYPGLFVAGLVFGGGLVATGRLGISILTHAAFNATGLALVLAAAAG
jgi:membrane protease YdiL (CAAX protease family)